MTREEHGIICAKLQDLQYSDAVSAFSVSQAEDEKPRIWLSWVGQSKEALVQFMKEYPQADRDQLQKGFYFFGNELRPGSGLIRVFGGKSEGPGGTLTCLLTSERSEDIYFASAGHVMTDFWKDTAGTGSIYHYRPGFPPSGSTRFLGKRLYLPRPWPIPFDRAHPERDFDLDIGIVKLDGEAELKARTTCYGTFGEWPPDEYCKVEEGKHVVKCGSQETHWTEAVIKVASGCDVTIYGPDKTRYRFHNQIILRDLTRCEAEKAEYPKNSPETPFAVPGDSGTMVVDQDTKRPVGMLIAGSILDGLYVVTPFLTIRKFFDERKLVMQRA